MISGEMGTLEAGTKGQEERLAVQDLRRSYARLLSFAASILDDGQTDRANMLWLEEKIESQLFPELEKRIETLRAYYRNEAVFSIRRTEKVQALTRGLAVMIVLLSLI